MIRTLATFAVAAVSLNAAASDDHFGNVVQSFERGFGLPAAGTHVQDETDRRLLLASFERIIGSNALGTEIARRPRAMAPQASARGLSRR